MPPSSDFKFKVATRGVNRRAKSWDIIYGGRSIGIVKRHPEYEGKFALVTYGGTHDDRVCAARWLLSQLQLRRGK